MPAEDLQDKQDPLVALMVAIQEVASDIHLEAIQKVALEVGHTPTVLVVLLVPQVVAVDHVGSGH